jgi:large repetitive protein
MCKKNDVPPRQMSLTSCFRLLRGVDITIGAQSLKSTATLSIPAPAGFNPALPVVVARKFDVKGGSRLKLVGSGKIGGSIISSDASVTAANTTSTATDFNDRMTSIAAPLGTTGFSYDGNGNLKSVTRGDATTSYAYDNKNRLTTTTDPEGNTTTYAYPTGGGSCSTCGGGSNNTTPTVITDPLGNITTNTLDKLGRIKQVSDPLNNLTNLSYDRVGRIRTRTDANGNQTVYSYDKLGRIFSQTDAEGGVTQFTYDKRGNLLTLADPENNTTNFEYDKAGKKTKETRPEGQETIYTYYANGLLKSVTDAKGQTTIYSYDKANRLTETRFADNTKHSFGYDKAGNMTSFITPDVQATISYDAANRKTGETVTIGAVTKAYSYSYDTKGNKESFTSPEGVTYRYIYNKNDQPKSITTPAGQITLDYSWVRNTKVTLPNGVTTDYSYNDNSWLSNIAVQKSPNTVFNAGYQFDKVGNITSKANDVTTNYGYDKIYQLNTASNPIVNEAFSYDKVGNRKTKQGTQTPWTYNKNSELLMAEVATFVYDNNGNTTTKTENGPTTTFKYGVTDRLASVQLPDGRSATYTYDPFGRRIKKQVGSEATFFVYADEGLIGEYTAQGAASKTYGWRPGSIWGTNPLYMVEGSNYYFYHNDHLGTPQNMTDATGDIVWEASYEAFGKAMIAANSTITNNLRFPGQYFDEETGLHYNWNRYYDTTSGRYFEKDLIGFGAGDENLYRYVKNKLMNQIDPFGLWGTNIHSGVPKPVYAISNDAGAPTGTYKWGVEVGIDPNVMRIISYYDESTDGGFTGGAGTGWAPVIGDQSKHFNKNPFGQNDSRLDWADYLLNLAIREYKKGNKCKAYKYIGMGLHSLQDYFAHRGWDTGKGFDQHPAWYDDVNDPRNKIPLLHTELTTKKYLISLLRLIRGM